MNRNALLMALLLTSSLLTFGLFGCQKPSAPDTNRELVATASNVNSPKENIDTAAIETELKRIENDWPRVLKDKDDKAIDLVEADDIVVIYPDGMVGSKAQDMSDIKNGAVTADAWDVSEVKVTVLGKDAAFATGVSVVKGGKTKTADGKTLDISGDYRFIDTFARRNGEWKLVASISTPIQKGASMASPPAKLSPAAPAPKAAAKPTP
jgi:hypothetical protein